MRIFTRAYQLSPSSPQESLSQVTLSSNSTCLNETIFSSPKSGLQIYRWQLIELMSQANKTMICTDVVDAWLELLVDYANRNVCKNSAAHTSNGFEGTATESSKRRRQIECREGEKPYHAIPIPLADTIFRTPTPATHQSASTYLKQHSLSPYQFLNAHTILLPLDIPIGGIAGHSILITVYPQRKVISIHDSWRPKRHSRARRIVPDLVWFLEGYLAALWEPPEWRIWVARGPWQRNGVDCGIWVCVSAWSVVMEVGVVGGGLMKGRLREEYDVKGMRERIFADILRGGLPNETQVPALPLGKEEENVTDPRYFEESTLVTFIKKDVRRSTCAMPPLRDIWQTITRSKKTLFSNVLPPCLRSEAPPIKACEEKIQISTPKKSIVLSPVAVRAAFYDKRRQRTTTNNANGRTRTMTGNTDGVTEDSHCM